MDELAVILDVANRLSGSLVVVLIIVGGTKRFRIWIFSWVHDEIMSQLRERCDYERREKEAWQQVAFKASGVAETFADIAKRA